MKYDFECCNIEIKNKSLQYKFSEKTMINLKQKFNKKTHNRM